MAEFQEGGIKLGQHSFQEVMRQMVRLHKSCNCGCIMTGADADQCPLYSIDDAPCEWINTTEKIPAEQIENAVMAWAAEHPEPVYPRWVDWLAEQGVLVCDNTFPNKRYWYAIDKDKIEQPIPTDIAQKLGIEPKEGV